MRIESFGGWLIGTVLLAVGIMVLASDIDPLVLCFKQCGTPKALEALFGSAALRVVTGVFFAALGLLFIVPLLGKRRQKQTQAPESQQ